MPLVRAVLTGAGLNPGVDVDIVSVGDGTALTVDALQTGQVDAYSSNLFDLAAIKASGIDMVDDPAEGSAGLSRQRRGRDRRGAVVEGGSASPAFLRAVAKGVVYAAAQDDKALEISKKIRPEEFELETLSRPELGCGRHPEDAAGLACRQADRHPFRRRLPSLSRLPAQGTEEEGALAADVDLSKALDSSLLEAANAFDRKAIRASDVQRQRQRRTPATEAVAPPPRSSRRAVWPRRFRSRATTSSPFRASTSRSGAASSFPSSGRAAAVSPRFSNMVAGLLSAHKRRRRWSTEPGA